MFNLPLRAVAHAVMGLGLLWSAAVLAGPLTLSADLLEVTDGGVGLIWRSCPEGQVPDTTRTCTGTPLKFTHGDALKRARDQALLTGKDWRVPNVKELSSIVDRTRVNPAFDTTVFPLTPGQNEGIYWTSTPEIGDVPNGGRRAITVRFSFGDTDFLARSSSVPILRLVRSAP
jgi:Protein of unknown function (DUF1566)